MSYFRLNPRVQQSGLGAAHHGRISKIGRVTRIPNILARDDPEYIFDPDFRLQNKPHFSLVAL